MAVMKVIFGTGCSWFVIVQAKSKRHTRQITNGIFGIVFLYSMNERLSLHLIIQYITVIRQIFLFEWASHQVHDPVW